MLLLVSLESTPHLGSVFPSRHVSRKHCSHARTKSLCGHARVKMDTTALLSETVSTSYSSSVPHSATAGIDHCLHEWIVHRDDEDLARVLELRRVDIAGDVVLRA